MEPHNPQLEAIRSELRKIRDAAEVVVLLLAWIVGILLMFSGWVWSRPVGWQAAVALVAIVLVGGWLSRMIREVR